MGYKAFIAKYIGENNKFLRYAPDFYRTFPHDHNIEVDLPVKILSQNTFLNLLENISQCKNRNILLVAHGNEKHGIYLGFGTNRLYKTYQVMFNMLYYARLMRLYNKIKSKKDPEEWLEIFKIIKPYNIADTEKAKNALISLDTPSSTDIFNEQKLRVERYKRMPETTNEEKMAKKQMPEVIINDFLKYIHYVLNDIVKLLGMPRQRLNKYSSQISAVQSLNLNNLAFRGCNIGKDKDLLEIYRRFFNVMNINAPKVKINFGVAYINLRRNQKILNKTLNQAVRSALGNKANREKWLGGPTKYLYGPKIREKTSGIYYHPKERRKNKDEFLLTIKSIRNTPYFTAVAEHIDIAKDFAISKFGAFAPNRKNSFKRNRRNKLFELPLCCLETFPIIFPQDHQFVNYIETVSGGCIRSINILSFPPVKVASFINLDNKAWLTGT